jgi:hypothetical protein
MSKLSLDSQVQASIVFGNSIRTVPEPSTLPLFAA